MTSLKDREILSFQNLDKLEDFEDLASDFQGDATKMATVFGKPRESG
jgi:hypothetical protein